MDEFGVRFSVNNHARFEALRSIYAELKRDKQAGKFRDPSEWLGLVPDEIKGQFSWPSEQDRKRWLAVRSASPIIIRDPSQQLGARWDFYRVFESIDEGDYQLGDCRMVADGIAEMHINPNGYPYGGLGPFIALAEAFGFIVLGVNEYGKYQTRAELLGGG